MGPLAGLKVLDLSRVLAGPWASQLLADLGADVIKVEAPQGGDDTRAWGPPWFKTADGEETADAAYFIATNRGKRSISIDISTEQGQATIQQLLRESDIFLENFKVGGLKKYGLDYNSLSRIKPDIIYCSITGFGQTGPMANRAGYDFMIQAMGGLMSVTGEADDNPGGGPQKVGVAISDISSGLYAVIGILSALRHRDQTGEGQQIDISLLDVTVGMLANQNMNWLIGGSIPQRRGNTHPNIAPYQVFQTKDGHIVLAVGNDGQFRAFCAEAGCPEVSGDMRYATNAARVQNRETLVLVIQSVMSKRTTSDWVASLELSGVPCGPINTVAEALQQDQIKARGLQLELPYGDDMVPQIKAPIVFSKTVPEYDKGPPRYGEHTTEILNELNGKREK